MNLNFCSLVAIICLSSLPGISQTLDSLLSETLAFRFAGPYRGGRCTAVAGDVRQVHTFYMGTTGGGVWKTTDAGQNWKNISDGQIKCGSIGSIALAPTASHQVWVGTGSDSPRGNISAGIGIYKSDNSGKDWKHMGLSNCGQIGEIVVHPNNPDIVYVAALGNIFKKNRERGVYKSTNGGKSWDQVLYLSDSVGCIDLEIDPYNSDILYAGMWRVERKPYTLIDGGNTGGLYKSTDGGKSWKHLTNGLPEGLIGKLGIAASPALKDRIWVIQESAEETQGGIYRSDDGGATFNRVNRDHKLRQRSWYYTRIFAHPTNENTVYVTNVGFFQSIDGGKHFDKRYRVPHGDCHDLWINPNHPEIMINSNDGGATISLNAGETWSTQKNQPTSELYRLSTDNQWPYRLYAGQQDNSTISVPSRSSGGIDPKQVWYDVGGGESADVAVHPENPDIIYASTYSGIITRLDRKTDEIQNVGAYPHYTEGTEQRDLKYRWQWNFPIRISRHNHQVIYHTSNYVHRSTNEGQSWEIISPDLTRNLDKYHGIPGGPIQHDGTGVEIYSTIFSLEESSTDSLTLWVGSDDGLLHITRDGGENWENITPKDMPTEGTINHIRLSSHQDGTAYVAVYNYRYGDFKPYLFRTVDFGKNWVSISTNNGIPEDHFVRCITDDPKLEGSLFAGTEFGLYHSFDNGTSWHPFQLNLPHTPITGIDIHQDNLVMSTQGRGFWILDNLSVIRQWASLQPRDKLHLFRPVDTYRSNVSGFYGNNAPGSATYMGEIYFHIDSVTQNAEIRILDESGRLAHRASKMGGDEKSTQRKLKIKNGLNKYIWDLRYPSPLLVKDLVMMDMRYPGQGPNAVPGNYKVELEVGTTTLSTTFKIKKDPRWKVTDEDLRQNFNLSIQISDLIDQSQRRISNLRGIRKQLKVLKEELGDDNPEYRSVKDSITAVNDLALLLEEKIYQHKIEVSQDEINYRRKWTNHIIRLYRVVIGQHNRPTQGELERWSDLQEQYKAFDREYKDLIDYKMPRFLSFLKEKSIEIIQYKKS